MNCTFNLPDLSVRKSGQMGEGLNKNEEFI